MPQDSDYSRSLSSISELSTLLNQVTARCQIPGDNIERRLLLDGVSATWLYPKCLQPPYTGLSKLLLFISPRRNCDVVKSLTRFRIHPPRITGWTVVVQDFGGSISARINSCKFPPEMASEFRFCRYSSALNRSKLAVHFNPTLRMSTFSSMVENTPGTTFLPDGRVTMVWYRDRCSRSQRSNSVEHFVP